MNQLLEWDKKLFFLINHSGVNDFFDATMPWFRTANTWIPLYLFIIAFVTLNFGKKGWLWVLFAVITVLACNFISSDIIKELIWRTRPCRDELLQTPVRLIVPYCPSSSSFTSSHAANHFGMAAFIFFSGRHLYGRWLSLFFLWGFIIIYAQVYVGVHYPLDVLTGALVGILSGWCFARFFNRKVGLLNFGNQPTA